MVNFVPVERMLMISDLKAQAAEVVFIKEDGNTRVMHCTLNRHYMPNGINIDHMISKDPPNVLTVWDIDQKDYRRIPLDRIVTVQAVNR